MGWFVRVSNAEFAELCAQGKIISNHGVYGPKVILMPDGDYIKVFNPKPGLTKRHFFPKYKTFIRNAEELKARGIPCIENKQLYFLTQKGSYAVRYIPLEGKDLRVLAQGSPDTILEELIPFLIELHNKGIYFRGIHLANVLKLDNGHHGIIDMADLRFKRGPLSMNLRVRNLKHMFKNKDDRDVYLTYGHDRLLNSYIQQAKLTPFEKLLFKFWVNFPHT